MYAAGTLLAIFLIFSASLPFLSVDEITIYSQETRTNADALSLMLSHQAGLKTAQDNPTYAGNITNSLNPIISASFDNYYQNIANNNNNITTYSNGAGTVITYINNVDNNSSDIYLEMKEKLENQRNIGLFDSSNNTIKASGVEEVNRINISIAPFSIPPAIYNNIPNNSPIYISRY